MTRFGGNEFNSFSVPLIFGNRAFLLEPCEPSPLVTVLLQHDDRVYTEILKNAAGTTPITTAERWPNGYVVVGNNATGRFVYKVRPGYETSVVFGTITGADGTTVRITDRYIEFGQGNRVENCTFDGAMAGIVVYADGSAGIGAPLPATLRHWFTRKS